jgi:5'-nucleotidase
MKIKKPILYIDLDGVTVDINSAVDEFLQTHPFVKKQDAYDLVNFEKMNPMQYSLQAIQILDKHFNVFFLSTAPWDHIQAWSDKRKWVAKYFPEFKKRLILTHRKDLQIGDYLIDDRTANGAGSFSGELIQFGTTEFPDWRKVLFYLMDKEGIHCHRCTNVSYDLNDEKMICNSCIEKLNR